MSTADTVESLKQFVIHHGLPLTGMALYGTRCPYCGKSDRIQPMEPPRDVPAHLTKEDRASYRKLWRQLAPADSRLGWCYKSRR